MKNSSGQEKGIHIIMNATNSLKINNQVKVKLKGKKVFLFNSETGHYIGLAKDLYQIIEDFIDSKMSVNEYMLSFETENERELFEKLIEKLTTNNYLVNEKREEVCKKIRIYWDITNNCNLNCIHCSVNAQKNKVTDEKEKVIKIAESIARVNPYQVVISGGEPLFSPWFEEAVNVLKKNNNIKMTLMTNATLIGKKEAEYIVKNFESVDISFDGYDEKSTGIIRGKGIFEKTFRGLMNLKKEGMENITASMIVVEDNIDDVARFETFCEEMNIRATTRELLETGRALENADKLKKYTPLSTLESQKEMIMQFRKKREIPATCGATYTTFQIDCFGDIYPCQILIDEKFILGNALEIEDMNSYIRQREFIDKEGYKEFEKYLPENVNGCEKCDMNLFCHPCPGKTYIYNSEISEEVCRNNRECYELLFD